MAYLYGEHILRVDLSDGKITKEPTAPYIEGYIGSRGINVRILYDEVPPEVAPLDPASVLIFGVGPLCGTPVPASRVEVTAKSPETGFLGSSNFGGYFGPELKFAGYDNIVITGKADKSVYLWIQNDEVEIRDASHLWGKDTYETQEIIRSEVDPDAKVACIGQAGENLVHFATVQSGLGHGAGRTGMGAVMGSKNLKAIVVRGTKGITLADPVKYLSIANEIEEELRKHPGIRIRQKYGSSFIVDAPRRREAQEQGTRQVFVSDLFLKHNPARIGCFGCPTQCMDLYPVETKGGGVISCTFYEQPFDTVRNVDLYVMLECGLWAQRYGVDIVSSMKMIAWLMELYEKGVITAKDTDGVPMEWGSKEAIMGVFKKIIFREGIGDVLADGILPATKRIGRGSQDYAPQIKGILLYTQSTPDTLIPLKGSALGMVVSSRGDTMRARASALEEGFVKELSLLHTNAYGARKGAEYIESVRQKVKTITGTEKAFLHEQYEGKPKLVAYGEDVITINDCLSVCKYCSPFLNYPLTENYQANLFSAGSGIETSVDKLFEYARRVRNLERAFCVREGMTRETDVLPKRFMDSPLKNGLSKGAVLESKKFERMKDEYYTLRGWDVATGIPTWEILEQLGLKDVAQDLEKRGKLPRQSLEEQSKKEKR